jgi:hypothetical protein
MNDKMRGIRLKQVNEEQEGYRALLDFFSLDSERIAAMSGAGLAAVGGVDQGLSDDPGGADAPRTDEPRPHAPVTARQKLSRLLREELEETLNLLDEALTVCNKD